MEDSITFEDLGLDERTLAAVARKGFETPSPIQILAIPRLLNGDANIIARARTGTGKTAAFGLPLVQELRDKSDETQALILEPTRELAMQTCKEMNSFTDGSYPRTCVLYGGGSYTTQIRDLKRGSEIVVGTPGRIQDHLERGTLDISKIKYFILDEGDEMLDMGFIDDIEHIFEQANPDARILLFSATMPAPILKIAQQFMGEYEIMEEEGILEEPLLIDQRYWVLREGDKIEALVRLIDSNPKFFGLVFTQTKSDADLVSRHLDEKGYEAAALHGDIPQAQREKILARFRSKKTRILVATDVAARGIDIAGLTHVVNYSLPFDSTTYVHRIGRTGRAGSSGVAVTFVTPSETRKLNFLKARVAKASKGDLIEGDVPSVKSVLKIKQQSLFDELKKSLGLKNAAAEAVSEEEAALPDTIDAISSTENAQTENAVVEAAQTENAQTEAASETSYPSYAENYANEKFIDENFSSETSARNTETENNEIDAATTASAETAQTEQTETARNEKPSSLIKANKMFVEMADELCEENDAREVLAAVLSVMYGQKLDKSRYEEIRGTSKPKEARRSGRERDRERGDFDDSGHSDQKRLYIQLGRRDGYNARSIADYFSDILNIPGKMVDRIDVSANFSLVSLPVSDADRMLDIANRDSTIPHIHVDTKAGGSSRSRRGGFESERDRERSRRGGFGRERRGFARERGFRDEYGSFSRRSSRPNPHTPTERSGRSSFFKSKRASREF